MKSYICLKHEKYFSTSDIKNNLDFEFTNIDNSTIKIKYHLCRYCGVLIDENNQVILFLN